MYLIATIDRMNVSFAKLEMIDDLGFSETAFGFGASLFFLGMVFFEVPANLVTARIGAVRMFTPILVLWGAVTAATAMVESQGLFYVLRFLLGVFEAGLLPGILYLLTLWVPYDERERITGLILMGFVAASILGSPICGALLDLDGVLGLRDWQWLFIVTGLPAIILGVLTPRLLAAGPEEAPFFSEEEKEQLVEALRAERAVMQSKRTQQAGDAGPLSAILDTRVILVGAVLFGMGAASYGMMYWLPTVVKQFGVSNTVNGLLSSLPWMFALVALVWIPGRAARRNERAWHIAVPAVVAAIAFVLVPLVQSNVLQFGLTCAGLAGLFGAQPIIMTLPSAFLKGPPAAAAVAFILVMANLGGFIAQNAIPFIRDWTGSAFLPMIFVAFTTAAAGALGFIAERQIRRHETLQAA